MVAASRPACALLATAILTSACQEARCKPTERCDIRKARCQESALAEAACLTGREVPDDFETAVRTISRQDLLDQRLKALEDAPPDAQQEALSRGLVLLELRAPDSTAEERAREGSVWVGGFYDDSERQITVVGAAPFTEGIYVNILVHEMVHALQGAAGDLDREGATFDEDWAHSAIIEGEATLAGEEAAIEGYGYRFEDARYTRALRGYRAEALSLARDSDDLLGVVYQAFTYGYGASYLWPIKRQRGPSAIAPVAKDPPASTYAVMQADATQPEARPNSLGAEAVPVLADFERVAALHLGRFAYEAWRTRRRSDMLPRDLPDSWYFVADTLSVFTARETGTVLAAWRLRFDDETALHGRGRDWDDDARDALGSRPTRIDSDGADIWFFAAEDAETLDLVPDTVQWEPAPEQDGIVELVHDTAAHTIFCPQPRLPWNPEPVKPCAGRCRQR